MSYTSLLVEICTIRRFTEGAADNTGRPVKTWADHLTDEACRLSTPSGREILIGAKLVIADYVIFLGDVDVIEQDQIEIGSITYEVLLVADRQDGIESHHKECSARTVR